MQVWINLIINTINISKKREIKNPQILINIKEEEIEFKDNCGKIEELILKEIKEEEIEFKDNCGKIEELILKEIKEEKYRGIGIKMAKEIAIKNGKKMIVSNSDEGAIFKFIKNQF
jgi:uncharacterized protein YdeI (BOF family)